ncbi:MAG: ABC transporter ATP-binding protein [Paramuribaculum sp.]|nr:ABC transporter ATP-binding protein [Paramuribaculum sp.]
MNAIVDISRLSARYGRTTALDDVSLQVDKGELFGVIGPDGAGKSTLYKILATLMPPASGGASVCGLDIVKDYRDVRSRIGYMPERFSLYKDLSVQENLKFFAALFGVSVRKNYDLIAPIFRQLERFPDRKAGALSGGMKQKLALSCALIHRPEILLLDEPTTGVDAVSRSEFWEILRSLKNQGITILVSTSYMDEANLCQRIAMIDRGRILGTDTPARLVARLGERLFAARADNMFRLLEELRRLPQVKECYTFGATLHVVVSDDFDPQQAARIMETCGLKDVDITPAKGTIEDLFIKLTANEN